MFATRRFARRASRCFSVSLARFARLRSALALLFCLSRCARRAERATLRESLLLLLRGLSLKPDLVHESLIREALLALLCGLHPRASLVRLLALARSALRCLPRVILSATLREALLALLGRLLCAPTLTARAVACEVRFVLLLAQALVTLPMIRLELVAVERVLDPRVKRVLLESPRALLRRLALSAQSLTLSHLRESPLALLLCLALDVLLIHDPAIQSALLALLVRLLFALVHASSPSLNVSRETLGRASPSSADTNRAR